MNTTQEEQILAAAPHLHLPGGLRNISLRQVPQRQVAVSQIAIFQEQEICSSVSPGGPHHLMQATIAEYQSPEERERLISCSRGPHQGFGGL